MHSCAKFKERRKNLTCSTLIMSAAGPKECILTHKWFVAELSVYFSIIFTMLLDRKVTLSLVCVRARACFQ